MRPPGTRIYRTPSMMQSRYDGTNTPACSAKARCVRLCQRSEPSDVEGRVAGSSAAEGGHIGVQPGLGSQAARRYASRERVGLLFSEEPLATADFTEGRINGGCVCAYLSGNGLRLQVAMLNNSSSWGRESERCVRSTRVSSFSQRQDIVNLFFVKEVTIRIPKQY